MRVIFPPGEPLPAYIEGTLDLWDRGFDTDRIAKILQEPQETVERWLHIGLEHRRHAKEAKGDAGKDMASE